MSSAYPEPTSDDHIPGIIFLDIQYDQYAHPGVSRISSPKWCIFPTAPYWALLCPTNAAKVLCDV